MVLIFKLLASVFLEIAANGDTPAWSFFSERPPKNQEMERLIKILWFLA